MRTIVSLPGEADLKVELGRRGFKVVGDMLQKKGVVYKMPRSIERALKNPSSYDGFNFELRPLHGHHISKVNPKPSGKKKPLPTPLIWNDWSHSITPRVTLKSTKPTYIVTDNAVSFFHNGTMHQASSANPMFNDIVAKLKVGKLDEASKLVNIANAIEVASAGLIKNDSGVLRHNNQELNETVTDWLIRNMGRNDGAMEAVINFLAKCKVNPNQQSIEMLWRFIRKNGLVLFHDGDFLGYRYINDNMMDCHSGKFNNTPGRTCKMPREEVTFDPNSHCASGLHVGAWSHVSGNSNIIEVRVNPMNVVSVPVGEDWKMRVCEFFSWRLLRHRNEDVAERTEEFVKL